MAERSNMRHRPVWAILGELSSLLGSGNNWYHDSQIRQEMVRQIKGIDGFENVTDKGRLLDFGGGNGFEPGDVAPELPSPARGDGAYILQWTPSVHHSGWISEKSENLMRIDGKQEAWLHPDDARREEISDGQVARIGTEATALNIPVKVTSRVNKGEILIVNSFSGNPVNRLMKRGRRATLVSVRKI